MVSCFIPPTPPTPSPLPLYLAYKETRARILKHFEMTVELKVWLQGFQISLQIFLMENANVESFNIIFYKYNSLHKLDFTMNTKKPIATVSPGVHSDLWKDSSPWKVDFSAPTECLRIWAQEVMCIYTVHSLVCRQVFTENYVDTFAQIEKDDSGYGSSLWIQVMSDFAWRNEG